MSAPAAAVADGLRRPSSYWAQSLRRLGRQPVTLTALVLLVCIFVVGGLAHEIAPHGWNAINLSPRWQNHAPTLAGGHLLGTDNIGRDVLDRTLWGLHYTEQNALLGALIATVLGVFVGSIAGYYGGWLDTSLMRFADLVTGLPVFVLMLVTFAFLQPVTILKATLVFGFYMWTSVARVVRARIAALSEEEYVQAARSLGGSDLRILARHLLPNAGGAIAVAATAAIGQIVLVEATVEFFGFGVESLIRPTLGNLLAESASTGIGNYNQLGLGWWVWAAPAAALVVILVCANLIGDGIGDALNPQTNPA